MSQRSDIKANLITAYKAITGVREVSTRFKTIEQVDKSKMPYIQAMSIVENRERADSNKNTNCSWEIGVWCYVQDEDDIEGWIEYIRVATVADRTRGGYARDTWMKTIHTDNVILGQTTRGLILITVVVEHRVAD